MKGQEVKACNFVGDENEALSDDVPLVDRHQLEQRHQGGEQVIELCSNITAAHSGLYQLQSSPVNLDVCFPVLEREQKLYCVALGVLINGLLGCLRDSTRRAAALLE